ncbi:hypothetical protein T05_8549 [Trichinella murrelli]|uniref:Uncharacterized protein n=1 Tax=Trichinella murrelli TaxID=144512 RepID=A0A0V0T2E7_9BILA|nr:hypothetical protein T05_8549 [Trichinella murrelli]
MCFTCLAQGHRSDRCRLKQRGWRTHRLLTATVLNRQRNSTSQMHHLEGKHGLNSQGNQGHALHPDLARRVPVSLC